MVILFKETASLGTTKHYIDVGKNNSENSYCTRISDAFHMDVRFKIILINVRKLDRNMTIYKF